MRIRRGKSARILVIPIGAPAREPARLVQAAVGVATADPVSPNAIREVMSVTRPAQQRPEGIMLLRQSLVEALQESCRTRRYDSPQLRRAIQEFARGATHAGLGLEWVQTSVEDAIETAVVPSLDEYQRETLCSAVGRMVQDADVVWPAADFYSRHAAGATPSAARSKNGRRKRSP